MLIESLPQCLVQAYIYVVVVSAAKAGTVTPNQSAMLPSMELLPRSILISLLATLKT